MVLTPKQGRCETTLDGMVRLVVPQTDMRMTPESAEKMAEMLRDRARKAKAGTMVFTPGRLGVANG